MWRFILVTFAFLAFAFYQLSGGAGYTPREDSRQYAASVAAKEPGRAQASFMAAQPEATSEAHVVLASAGAAAQTAAVAGAEKRVRLTVGEEHAAPETAGVTTVVANPEKIARLLDAAKLKARDEPAQRNAATENGTDIRKVISQRVNLRKGPGTDYDVAGKLTRGMEVRITSDDGAGWVELEVLETGQKGWIADFLLSPKG